MYKYILFIAIVFISCNHPTYKDPHVIINTRFGDIELELYADKAPKTVAAFLSNVDAGLYTNGTFYRVLKAEQLPTNFNPGIIQGGIWQSVNKLHPPVTGIVHESTKQTGLSHTDGIISMARKDTGTATTEFFICIGDQSSLDFGKGGNTYGQGFAAFGKVFRGMNIVKKIQSQKSHGENFDEKVVIREIEKL